MGPPPAGPSRKGVTKACVLTRRGATTTALPLVEGAQRVLQAGLGAAGLVVGWCMLAVVCARRAQRRRKTLPLPPPPREHSSRVLFPVQTSKCACCCPSTAGSRQQRQWGRLGWRYSCVTRGWRGWTSVATPAWARCACVTCMRDVHAVRLWEAAACLQRGMPRSLPCARSCSSPCVGTPSQPLRTLCARVHPRRRALPEVGDVEACPGVRAAAGAEGHGARRRGLEPG